MPLSLAHAFERTVLEHPHRAALQQLGEAPRTYGELGSAAAAIAGTLNASGIGRGDRVGLLIPKSSESIAAVWGTLCSGAAYVPLDPTAPAHRAGLIAADCAMAGVLVSGDLEPSVMEIRRQLPQIKVFQVHGHELAGVNARVDLWGSAAPLRPAAVNARDLAYILYTSGSTGAPKGVMMSHAAGLSFPEWAVSRFDVTQQDRLSSHAPLHFDLSTFDVFGAVLAGACLIPLDEETVRFPMAAADALERERISVWYSVPLALRSMLRSGRLASRDLSALRVVFFAGEVYPADELHALQHALPHARLANLYGPTETNVCTYWELPPQGDWTHPSIGIDCDNCQGFVVNEQLHPVPDGERGELLVRGGTIMEGYWGDPSRTARTLVPNSLFPHLTDRMVRTGDVVSRLPDGSYAFHGRRDHMVKVRGYRVELGEVEAALHEAGIVTDAAVVPWRGHERDETQLVAFLVATPGVDASAGAARLRRHLTARLPKYMVPSDLRWLDRLPLTSTGKIDRQALTAMLGA